MATVRLSAARVASILRNRHLTAEMLAERLKRPLDVEALATRDTELALEDLEVLSSALGRTWAYLLIDDPEPPPRTGADHRTVANRRWSLAPELLSAVQAVEDMLDAAIELFPTVALPSFNLHRGVDIEEAGRRVRAALGVSVDQQLAAPDAYAALRLWIGGCHAQGIFVSQRRLQDPTVRALSVVRDGRAAIVVDTGDGPNARAFSVLHEYVHVVRRNAGVCDLDEHSIIERFCNAVAATALLPRDVLAREAGRSWGVDSEGDDAHLQHLSARLKVSQAALLVRMRDLEMLSQGAYEVLEARRQVRRGPERPGGGDYYRNNINRVGRLFARSVFDAYDAGAVDRQDVAALLGVGEHNVAQYRVELAGSRSS